MSTLWHMFCKRILWSRQPFHCLKNRICFFNAFCFINQRLCLELYRF